MAEEPKDPRSEELTASADDLLKTIQQVLKNNAIEVWPAYQQISIR